MTFRSIWLGSCSSTDCAAPGSADWIHAQRVTACLRPIHMRCKSNILHISLFSPPDRHMKALVCFDQRRGVVVHTPHSHYSSHFTASSSSSSCHRHPLPHAPLSRQRFTQSPNTDHDWSCLCVCFVVCVCVL